MPVKTEIAGPLTRLIWQLGGADPDVLEACPSHEKMKFFVIALFHIFIATGLAWITSILVERLVLAIFISTFSANAPSSYQQSLAVALLIAPFLFVVILRLLITGAQSFVGRPNRNAFGQPHFRQFTTIVKPFIPAAMLALWGTVMIGLISNTSYSTGIYISYVFQFLVLLSPIATASIWTSRVYDDLLGNVGSAGDGRPSDPWAGEAAKYIALAATALSDEEQARLTRVQETFDKNPQNSKVGRALIDLYKSHGWLRETLPVFDAMIIVDPTNTSLIREKAAIYHVLGDESRYRKTLEQVDHIQARESFEQNVSKRFLVSDLKIKGLSFFGDFTWEFQPGLNLLLGKNGYGKTHLLRALVAVLQSDEAITERFLDGSIGTPSITVRGNREGDSLSTVRTLLVFDQSFGKVPVLAIPDIRNIDKSRDSFSPPSEPMVDFRSQGARHFLNEQPYEGLVLDFFYELCLDYVDNNRSFESPVFKLIEDAVTELTHPLVSNDKDRSRNAFKFHEIKRLDSARFEILVMTDGIHAKPLPLQRASQGTLSVISMVGLIYKFLKALYPKVPESLVKHQQAIVVIDEIDAHLHPSWQQRIVGLFRDNFPNVQFIITAHSPLVVAGAREREVWVLRASDDGFSVKESDGHFIGATAAEMYGRVFEIEEKDATYLRLATLHMDKKRIENDVQKLESVTKLDDVQEREYETLASQLGELRQFEKARDRREVSDRLTSRHQDLTIETMRLQAVVEDLTLKLSAYETPSAPSSHITPLSQNLG